MFNVFVIQSLTLYYCFVTATHTCSIPYWGGIDSPIRIYKKDRHNQELQDDYVKIQNFQQTAAQDLQRQQDTLLAPITQKLQNAIQAVGAEGGYTFIFDQAAGSIIYTGANAEDVSAKVKAKLGIK